jgi:hypothetical protein
MPKLGSAITKTHHDVLSKTGEYSLDIAEI